MKDVYPEFADQVDFYAVGQDPSESLKKMERYRQEQGYPPPVQAAKKLTKTNTTAHRKPAMTSRSCISSPLLMDTDNHT